MAREGQILRVEPPLRYCVPRLFDRVRAFATVAFKCGHIPLAFVGS
jgi:hypothetical protein